MGMCVEVEGKIIYTVMLTDEDVLLIKQWIDEHEEDLPSFDMKENIAYVIRHLYDDGKISLYDKNKAVESDFYTESISWSEFEENEPEEILSLKGDIYESSNR